MWIVSGTGSEERKVFELETWSFGLDWLNDGRSVVVSQPNAEGLSRLVRLSLDSAHAEEIITTDPRASGDYKPAVSPDGAWVAFVRTGHLGTQDVYIAPTKGGEGRQVRRNFRERRAGDDHAQPGDSLRH